MRKKIVGFGLLLLFACKKNTVLTTPGSADNPAMSNGVAAYLQSKGFNVQGLRQNGDCYVVEGDILLDKKAIEAGMKGPLPSQAATISSGNTSPIASSGGAITPDQYALSPANSSDGTGIIGWANTGNITYFIDPSVLANLPNNADWINAINTAAQNWTSIANCSLNFTQVANANAANLIFYADNAANVPAGGGNMPANLYAWTRFPSNNLVGSAVIINHNGPVTDANGKLSAIRHEMGHAVGMRHADVTVDGEPLSGIDNFNQKVSETILGSSPSNDASSIMHSSFAGSALINFDAWDLFAARILYPDNIMPTNLTFFVYTPNQGGNRTPPSAVALYINLNGDTWNILKVDRVDASGNVISSYSYTGQIENSSIYTGLNGNHAPPTYVNVIINYEPPQGNLPRGTLYFRVSVYNYKNDFGFVLPTQTFHW
ncbi:MAG TPA: M57 family metalloprotease [Puia sp.]|nr:M57 family metalloprotease [Puia sp.]